MYVVKKKFNVAWDRRCRDVELFLSGQTRDDFGPATEGLLAEGFIAVMEESPPVEVLPSIGAESPPADTETPPEVTESAPSDTAGDITEGNPEVTTEVAPRRRRKG